MRPHNSSTQLEDLMNVTALRALLTPVLAARHLELDDLVVVPAGKRSLLRVTVDGDGPLGKGPTLDEIAVATRAVSDALDSSPVVGDGSYVLEVSSRGVGTPLSKPAHWRRNVGRLVRVLVDGQSRTGRIIASDDEGVTIEADGSTDTFAYARLAKAAVQVELNRKPDPDLDDVGEADDDIDVDATAVADEEEN
jgi:ribosome maturation factor RimP